MWAQVLGGQRPKMGCENFWLIVFLKKIGNRAAQLCTRRGKNTDGTAT